ncbi:MAG TPA: ribosomal protein S18-alanine N-acetyltransferase [Myxococcaceae bacterium]|nr:ribosomal protein S18-alanine N-acetyltransferase [Myxococcaceae bacterium]
MRKLQEDPAPFHVRPMTAADLPRVLEIEQVAFKNPWSADLLRRELGHDWSTILVAEEPGLRGQMSLLGFVIFWVVHDELHVLNVATAPEHRGRGVARLVLQAALDHGRRRRCTLATLEVRRSNGAALGLYRDFGFRPVGIRPNYYVDEGEDAIVMVLDL